MIAQSVGGGSLPIPTWIGELAFGAVVILALLGYIWFKPAVSSLMERIEKAEGQRDSLIEVYQDEIIPALRDVTVAAAKIAPIAEASTRTNQEAMEVLREVRTLLHARGGA
jgi:hypothetical protein